jgi:hypothetical protein
MENKTFEELFGNMSPEAQERSHARTEKMLEELEEMEALEYVRELAR